MFNVGDFKRFLSEGQAARHGLPLGLPMMSAFAMDESGAVKTPVHVVAKTFLRKTLAEHDKTYHKDGYKEGDKCNFREALMRGDPTDELERAERKEAEAKVGLVKYIEGEDGEKTVVGIVAVRDDGKENV